MLATILPHNLSAKPQLHHIFVEASWKTQLQKTRLK
jgi:hypothetical protein